MVVVSLEMVPHVGLENKVNGVAPQEGSAPGVGNGIPDPKSMQGSGHSRQWGRAQWLLDLVFGCTSPHRQMFLGFTHLECEVSALVEHSETQNRVWVSSLPSPTVWYQS